MQKLTIKLLRAATRTKSAQTDVSDVSLLII